MTIRVFQVATGSVGSEMVGRLQRLPALNAIAAVAAAPPGIVTSADLPLRAFAGRFVA